MLFYTFTTGISYIPEMKHMFDMFMIPMFKIILPISVKHDHQFSTYMIFWKLFLRLYFLNTTSS